MNEDDVTIDALIRKVLSYNPGADAELLNRVYAFSRDAHRSQTRDAGTPYISHPLSVAGILAGIKMDVPSIAAGLLHDTIEDAETTLRDIKESFGAEVAFLVDSLTKLSRIEFKTKEEAQAENFRKMLLAMSKDIRVIIIKFADRLHNMRTIHFLPEERRNRIATETLEIYAPLANRLGIGWLRVEFEDLCFKTLLPDLYDVLTKKVAKRKEEQEGYIKEVAEAVEARLRQEGLNGRVFGRVKHYYGIYQKMQEHGIPFEQVHDVIGLRIITDTNANCYTIMGIIHSLWTPIPGRFKDYIAMPKSNMYQSLHTTVIGPGGERVEFQIRTEDMNRIAEEGIASHWKYKERGSFEDRDNKYISWLRDLIKSQKEDPRDAREFLEAVKGEVMPEVVYVFTPKGKIIELPVGSTPVDFAYSIHTQVGHRCVGAKVNGKIVPLRYQLLNGDVVEAITSSSHGPSRDWLKFVVSQRAKNRIKQWIKAEERTQSVELGTKLLDAEMRKHHLRLSAYKPEELQSVARTFSLQSFEDLLVSVGYGKVSPQQVAHRLLPEKPHEETMLKAEKPKEQKGIRIKGVDQILYHTAKCCFPVPGDALVGFVTRGRGVTIHRRDCHNLESLAVDDTRCVDVEWKPEGEATSTAKLILETVDRPGMLADLSALISSMNVNISHVEATTSQERKARITMSLNVRDKLQLTGLIQKIMQTEGVLRVSR